jgi:hypothetical protein
MYNGATSFPQADTALIQSEYSVSEGLLQRFRNLNKENSPVKITALSCQLVTPSFLCNNITITPHLDQTFGLLKPGPDTSLLLLMQTTRGSLVTTEFQSSSFRHWGKHNSTLGWYTSLSQQIRVLVELIVVQSIKNLCVYGTRRPSAVFRIFSPHLHTLYLQDQF